MKKKYLTTGAAVLLMSGALSVPINAASTEVSIGVTQTSPKVVCVDVPTSFAIAVVADQRTPNNKPDVLVGSSTTVQGKSTLDFYNRGKEEASIQQAEIYNSDYSKWKLSVGLPDKAHMMNIKFGDFTLNTNVGIGGEGLLLGPAVTLPANETTQLNSEVSVGGINSDYAKAEKDAVSYYVSWTIEAK